MELVYLWVEGYKNIEQKGFDLLSKYLVTYDHVSNELIIDKKENFIENFYTKDIEISAIVGKNGSGKSSLFQIIYFLIYQNNLNIEQQTILKKKKEKFISFESGRERWSGNLNSY